MGRGYWEELCGLVQDLGEVGVAEEEEEEGCALRCRRREGKVRRGWLGVSNKWREECLVTGA